MQKVWALIPARGGSKRIPGKNIRPFLGKPILSYGIDAALKTALFSEVYVSTDEEMIVHTARTAGAAIHSRSQVASSDTATISEVISEFLQDMGLKEGHLCLIYATAPFVTADILALSYEKFIESAADSLLPVVRFSFPIQRALRSDDGWLHMFWPENLNTRSQDLPPAFHDAGLFFWIDIERFIDNGKVLSEKTMSFEIDEIYCQDIDNETDWKLAELKYKLIHSIS